MAQHLPGLEFGAALFARAAVGCCSRSVEVFACSFVGEEFGLGDACVAEDGGRGGGGGFGFVADAGARGGRAIVDVGLSLDGGSSEGGGLLEALALGADHFYVPNCVGEDR